MAPSARPLPLPTSTPGSYTGNGTNQTILVGYTPTMVRIFNNIGDLEIYEFVFGQTTNTAYKQTSRHVLEGIVKPTSVAKGMKILCRESVTFDATPGGNQVYLKFTLSGLPFLASNLANELADVFITKLHTRIIHDVAAATGGLPVFMDDTAFLSRNRLLVNNTILGNNDIYIECAEGSCLKIKHDVDAATKGTALFYDDATDDRFEADLSKAADNELITTGDQWNYPQDRRDIMTNTVGSVSISTDNSIEFIKEDGISLVTKGFVVGSERALNAVGENYDFITYR